MTQNGGKSDGGSIRSAALSAVERAGCLGFESTLGCLALRKGLSGLRCRSATPAVGVAEAVVSSLAYRMNRRSVGWSRAARVGPPVSGTPAPWSRGGFVDERWL
jgi:hypothetical protein